MKIIVLGALLTLAFACGKKNESGSSSSDGFSSRLGVSSCEKSIVIIPTSAQTLPSLVVDSRTYQVGQGTSQQAWQTLTAMYYGQAGVPPYSQTSQDRRYRATVCATPSSYGYGQSGYSVGGYQQPANPYVLDIQSIQPY